jgi:hypothetical protein
MQSVSFLMQISVPSLDLAHGQKPVTSFKIASGPLIEDLA